MIKIWPDYPVASFRWKRNSMAVVFKSLFGSQAVESSLPVWEVEMTGLPEERAYSREIERFIESLDGYKNQLAIWNIEHPVPAGTMRGSMTLNVNAAQGATSLVIVAPTEGGKTLLAGDYLGIGSGMTQQVVRVEADATASGPGVITVSINIPLRNSFLAGTQVVWDKPKALFRQKEVSEGVEYTPNYGSAWSLSLIEDWRP